MSKAFGKQGDFIYALNSGATVCQSVLDATLHSECSLVRILCIEGGPNCDEENAAIPALKKAVADDLKKQTGRQVEVASAWMRMELFETEFGTLADEAAAAKRLEPSRYTDYR